MLPITPNIQGLETLDNVDILFEPADLPPEDVTDFAELLEELSPIEIQLPEPMAPHYRAPVIVLAALPQDLPEQSDTHEAPVTEAILNAIEEYQAAIIEQESEQPMAKDFEHIDSKLIEPDKLVLPPIEPKSDSPKESTISKPESPAVPVSAVQPQLKSELKPELKPIQITDANTDPKPVQPTALPVTTTLAPEQQSQIQPKLNLEINTPVNQPKWAENFSEKIVMLSHLDEPEIEAEIKLTPQNLGPMSIKLKINQENNQASVIFTVQQAPTREAIETALPRLQAMMSEGGFDLVDVDVREQPQRETKIIEQSEKPEPELMSQAKPRPTGLIDFYA